ncbi:MAG TPA: ParB N-terminal domain-containing protein [Planctomycetota bacterium]|nr:ParB N-terminal domain-containing protein [Planctomycetota bacterium]
MTRKKPQVEPGLSIELRPTASIIPYARNPRVNDPAVDAVAASIREFGFRQPIVVDAAGVIVVGHTRWKAATKLGLTQVPVHVARDLTPAQAKAYRIADNKTASLSSWDAGLLPLELSDLKDMDFDLAITGFTDAELDELLHPIPPQVTQVPVMEPPRMTWVLIGIPTVKFGTIAPTVDKLAEVPGILIETVVNANENGQDRQ